ncbi:MAG: hypothetical protein H8D46_00455 [FCB group bacterium]|nr:hypothetical protein [FCB group bacterium]
MIKFQPGEEIKSMICEQMGDDMDNPLCEELTQYMEECPECKVYYDSVKKVVKLYKICEQEKELPEDISDRLFKVLHLNRDKE